MIKKSQNIVALFYALLLPVCLWGQITVNKTSGCAPLNQVEFSHPNSGSWDFGDGASGSGTNVSNSYTTPGTYTVVFSEPGQADETVTIEVFGNPSPEFNLTGPAGGCVPLSTSFEDASTGGGGTNIVSWQWAFGDGGANTTTGTPSYIYTIAGTYDVSLIVIDANGCDSAITKENLITVTQAPRSIFTTTPNPASACTGPLTVSFTNSSINSTGGTTDLSYSWDFGNGETSTDRDPASVTYTNEGTYIVTLEVTETGGCTVTSSRTVNIGNPVAVPDLPDTVCINSFILGLGNNSVGASSYIWQFDGGPTYTSTNPNHTFNVAGDQQITLTANSSQGCSDDSVVVVHVEDPSVDFVRTPTYLCQEPYCFAFDGQTSQTNVAEWTWDFGDGLGVEGKSEDTTYCYHVNDTVYYVHNPYYFQASVEIETTNGCKAEMSYIDTIIPVSAFFVPDSSMGCAPLTVTFSDSTRSRESIVSWSYDFGDGGSSTDQNPTHTFTAAGEYEVVVTVENSLGCRDTSFPVTILVGEPIPLSFSVSDNTVCVGETVTFNDTSGNTDIDYYHFSTNSNKSGDCVTSGSQQYASFDEVGQHDVTFYANYNGCISSNTQPNAVTVEGPVSYLRYNALCANPLDYTFTGAIEGATSWDWDFGDGNTVAGSSDSIVSHTYAASGDYTVTLITFNNGNSCAPDTQSLEVNVRQISAVITGDAAICNEASYNFSGGSSNDVYNSCSDAYWWDMGDQTVPRTREDSLISFAFPDTGDYTIRLITHDINNCKDTATYDIKVNTIVARIGADTLRGCLPLTINLADSSFSDTTIVEWLWTTGTIPNPLNDTISQTSTGIITYSTTSDKEIQLIVRDSLGCKDTASVVITPLEPNATFTALTDRTICVGDSVRFQASDEAAITTFNWDFGSAGTSTDPSPYFTFGVSDTFDVTLNMVDTNGCVESSTRTTYVSVQDYPDAGYLTDQDLNPTICHPANVQYSDTSKGAVVNYYWDLGTGGAIINAPVVTPPAYERGTYETELIVETEYGCRDTATRTIEVVGPVADFDMSDKLICTGETVTFTIKDSVDVDTYLWDFGDGTDAENVSPISHTYKFTPTKLWTVVKLITQSSLCEYTVEDTLRFEEVSARFELSDTIVCANETVTITDGSLGADVYSWTLSNGTSLNTATVPAQTFGVGTQTIELIIENNLISCTDTLRDTLQVLPIPAVLARDTGFCAGDVVTLVATGDAGVTYNWNGNVSNPNSAITNATISESTDFTVTVSTDSVIGTRTKTCMNTDVANIYIQQSFDPISVDTCGLDGKGGVVIGEVYTIGTDEGSGYTYLWEGSESDKVWLTCTDCPTQEIQVTEEVGELNYTLTYTDSLGCFDNVVDYRICIRPSYTFDVPTAFTPDGDGINDIVYLRGHGIVEVITFKIFNRWGELVFESTSMDQGWDGIYKGAAQGMETYIYKAEVRFYNGETESKGGSLNLIR